MADLCCGYTLKIQANDFYFEIHCTGFCFSFINYELMQHDEWLQTLLKTRENFFLASRYQRLGFLFWFLMKYGKFVFYLFLKLRESVIVSKDLHSCNYTDLPRLNFCMIAADDD